MMCFIFEMLILKAGIGEQPFLNDQNVETICHSLRLDVTADHSALGRGLPTEALLKEDLAVNACDLYGLGNVQCQGGVKLVHISMQFPSHGVTKGPNISCLG